MKKTVFSHLAVALIAALLAGACGWYFTSRQEQNSQFSVLRQVSELIDEHAVYDFSTEEATKNAVIGYLSGLQDDRYTEFWTPEEYRAYRSKTEGNFSGIGLSLLSEDTIHDGMFVYRVIGNSPAERAGVRVADRIVSVDGDSVLDRAYSEVMDELHLVEAGTTVSFGIDRGGESLTLDITFEDFVQTYVESRMIGDLAFIRIHSFMPSSYTEFSAALDRLLRQDPKGIVIDLRNNLGGDFNAVHDILDLLLPKDEMVVLKYKDREEVFYSSGERKTDLPIAVLINGESASASELMASCLRDVVNAPLIGMRSYGKGIGQTTYVLPDGSAVKMTTFYYLTKARNDYHGIGLQPDYEVDLTAEEWKLFYALTEENDSELQKAIEILHTAADAS